MRWSVVQRFQLAFVGEKGGWKWSGRFGNRIDWGGELIYGMGEALLEHTSINFIDGVCQRNWPVTGWRSAILFIAFMDHDNFA